MPYKKDNESCIKCLYLTILRCWRTIIRCSRARGQDFDVIRPNLRHITSTTLLVDIVTGSELTFHVEFVTLVNITLHHFCQTSPQQYAVPFCSFRHLRAIGQGVTWRIGGQRKCCRANTIINVANVGFLPYVTNEHNFVERHGGKRFLG